MRARQCKIIPGETGAHLQGSEKVKVRINQPQEAA